MNYSFRRELDLVYSEGEVIPCFDCLPRELLKPLVMSFQDSVFPARFSGRRSALLELEGKTYKLKGCNPQPGLFSGEDWLPELKGNSLDITDPSGKPKGSMNFESAKLELEEQLKVSKKLGEYNLPSPLYPVALYKYDLDFDKNRACAVSLTTGDLRLHELSQMIHRLDVTLPDYKSQLYNIYQWVGFAQYLTKETFGCLGEESNGSLNYVIYEIPEGYALMRVDFSHRKERDRVLVPHSYGGHSQYVLDLLKDLNVPNLSRVDFDSLEIHFGEKDCLTWVDDIPLLHVSKNNPFSEDAISNSCEKGLEGEVPNPISTEFINSLLN